MANLNYTIFDSTKLSTAEMYGQTLVQLAEQDDKVVGLSADLAKSTKIGALLDKFPNRLFNVGIAEQNMFGMAAGLAQLGFTPFASTFAVFASMRAVEQVRTDICYQNLNVKIIATHAGLSFGQAGTTHHCTEDIGIMRSIANMKVIVPADGMETSKAVLAAYETPGPVYIRINRGFDLPVFTSPEQCQFELGKAQTLHEGSDLTIIACGSGVPRALQAAQTLKEHDGIYARVLNMSSIKPIDEEAIVQAVHDTRRIVTVEDHNILGGLGSAVADVIAASGKACAFQKLGVPDAYSIIGLHEDLMSHFGYDTNGILATVRELMNKDFEEDDNWEDEL